MTVCIIIERDNRIKNPDARDSIIGGRYELSWDAAREVVCSRCGWGNEIIATDNDVGSDYYEVDSSTGEILKEYFISMVRIPAPL